jgi:hypothetical protein
MVELKHWLTPQEKRDWNSKKGVELWQKRLRKRLSGRKRSGGKSLRKQSLRKSLGKR